MPDLKQFAKFGKKIIAVGRNSRSLAAQLGKPIGDEPLLFLKPSTSYLSQGGSIVVPPKYSELVHEVELGVVIGKGGKNIPESSALSHIGGYALALDMTAYGKPELKDLSWSIAKGHDTFCPVSSLIKPEKISLEDTRFWLKVDGELKQDSTTKDMVFTVPHLISHISKIFTLETGDFILTGTQAGMGPVKRGQTITAGIHGQVEMFFPVIGQDL